MAAKGEWKEAGKRYLVNLLPLVVTVRELAKDDKVSMRGVGLVVVEMLIDVIPALAVMDGEIAAAGFFALGGRLAMAGLGMLLHEDQNSGEKDK